MATRPGNVVVELVVVLVEVDEVVVEVVDMATANTLESESPVLPVPQAVPPPLWGESVAVSVICAGDAAAGV